MVLCVELVQERRNMNEEGFIKAGREWLAKEKLKELERHKQNNKEFFVNNPSYRDEHKESINASSRRYKKTGKGKVALQRYNKTENGRAGIQRVRSKRRANEENMINTLTAQEWLDILRQYNFKCTYCGREFNIFNKPERDHVIPISRSGNNIKDNIVPACRSCNAKKGDKVL